MSKFFKMKQKNNFLIFNIFSSLLAKMFLDLDLSILASDDDVYDQYAKNIRQEYIHVPEKDYCIGKKKILLFC